MSLSELPDGTGRNENIPDSDAADENRSLTSARKKAMKIIVDLKNGLNPLHFNYEKSVIMATYMLCGFANFASIGIQIGGIGALEPKQRKNLSKFGFKALIGGTLASLLSATIAGMIIG